MLEKLMDSPIAWAILAIIAVASFIYAIICQQRNKERKEFSYSLKSNSLISGKKSKFEKLFITYDGQQIESLCVSKFTIWNSGNKTLNHTDMVESKELTVSVSNEYKILDVELITSSDKTNKFSLKKYDEHTVKILFDYADKKEGMVIQIIHTGTKEDICIDCKIKGGKAIKNINNETFPKVIKRINRNVFDKLPIIIMGIMLTVLLLFAMGCTISIFNLEWQSVLFKVPDPNSDNIANPQTTAITLSIFLWVYNLIMFAVYFIMCKKNFNMGIPKELRKYADF